MEFFIKKMIDTHRHGVIWAILLKRAPKDQPEFSVYYFQYLAARTRLFELRNLYTSINDSEMIRFLNAVGPLIPLKNGVYEYYNSIFSYP